jgi:SAM-dependent methyltransferase
MRLLGHRELTVQAIARYARRWYRRLSGGIGNPFDSPLAARGYAAGRPNYHAIVAAAVADVLGDVLPVPRAIDVGCGTGQSTEALGRLAVHVVGLDASTNMIREARRAVPRAFAVAKAEALPIRNRSVDLVVASAAFHWFDQRRFLAEARRIARRGAWLVVYDHGFSGTVEGADDFPVWHRGTYLARYPGVARYAPFSPRLASRAGFTMRSAKRYVTRVEMDAEGLARFLVTQSNVIAAIESSGGSADAIAADLRAEMAPFFTHNGQPTARRCIFGGPLWIATYDGT